VQIINKNCCLELTAAQLIADEYDLNDFYDFHAEMIRQAARGKLVQFLKLSETSPNYKIISKRFDRSVKEYIFTVVDNEGSRLTLSAAELSKDKNVLTSMKTSDIYSKSTGLSA